MYCEKCGAPVRDGANFCANCGSGLSADAVSGLDIELKKARVESAKMKTHSATGSETIARAKVTLVFSGYGWLTLTRTVLAWNKSASSFIAFGALSALTANNVSIMLDSIVSVGKYAYFPGGGLFVALSDGSEYKFSFMNKKDFAVFYGYLQGRFNAR